MSFVSKVTNAGNKVVDGAKLQFNGAKLAYETHGAGGALKNFAGAQYAKNKWGVIALGTIGAVTAVHCAGVAIKGRRAQAVEQQAYASQSQGNSR